MDKVQITQKHFYQMAITNVRYALVRDNHLAPWSAIEMIKEYIVLLEKNFRKVLVQQLTYEIEQDLAVYNREFANEWYEFIKFLETVS